MAGLYLALAGERGDARAGWAAPPPSTARRLLAGLAALLLAAGLPLWSASSADGHVAFAPHKPDVVHDHDDDGGPGDGGGGGDGGHGLGKARMATVEG